MLISKNHIINSIVCRVARIDTCILFSTSYRYLSKNLTKKINQRHFTMLILSKVYHRLYARPLLSQAKVKFYDVYICQTFINQVPTARSQWDYDPIMGIVHRRNKIVEKNIKFQGRLELGFSENMLTYNWSHFKRYLV